jgi:excisionase family DNA binding protein
MKVDEKKLYTVTEAAKLLNISRMTLYRWRDTKGLIPVRIGSAVMYKRSSILKAIKQQRKTYP